MIKGPQDGAEIASRFIGRDDREVFFVMCLNPKNHVVAVHRCHIGSVNASIVHPREVFKSVILNNAAGGSGVHIGMKNQWRSYNLWYAQCYINFAFFLLGKWSLIVGWSE